MKKITLWTFVIFISHISLALISFLENGYQEELLNEEVLKEAVLQAKVEDVLVKRELHRLTAEAELFTKIKVK